MLTLKNFEEEIGAAIVRRGLQYYKKGAVTGLENNENIWEAEVDGSGIYSVEIEIKGSNQVKNYVCDCPYDGGACKHVVAVLFAIRKETEDATPGNKKPGAKAVFENLLQKITLTEYQDFIRHYASKSKAFKTDFELHFADKDSNIDIEKKYDQLVQKIISKHSDRGFIDYYSTSKLAADIDKLHATATELLRKNNFSDAFAIARVLIRRMMEAITSCDDSNGNIGGLINDAVQLLEMITDSDKAARTLKEQVFIFLEKELTAKIYFDYGDFGYDMFALFQNLALQLNNKEDFLNFIEAQIPSLTGAYDNYRREFFQKQKIEFLTAIGKVNEAEELIKQHLDITEIRQAEIEKAIHKKDYEQAKQLIKDGIKIAQKKEHQGTVNEWEKQLLRIAVLEKDINTVRFYTKHFAFDRWFDKEYYNQWKKTYGQAEWKYVIDSLIDEKINKIKQQNQKHKGWGFYSLNTVLLQTLGPVYIEEQYWKMLLELVQAENNLNIVLQYHDHLRKVYPDELLAIYLPLLEAAGDRANSRSEYAHLAATMKNIIKDIPGAKTKIAGIVQILKTKYPRRPAMIEELNNI